VVSSGLYELGFGGVYGTELFMPVAFGSIEGFIQGKIRQAKKLLNIEQSYWESLEDNIRKEFSGIKEHYQLKNEDERDYIRLFFLLNTARYGSTFFSAFNLSGYQLDPYGSYAVLSLAFCVPPKCWGDEKSLGGVGHIQKAAIEKINPRIGYVMAYGHLRPMLPLSLLTLPKYLMGFSQHIITYFVRRAASPRLSRVAIPQGSYLTEGWEAPFLQRTVKRYGLIIPNEKT
jgi:hypothetical protein